jgi:hypothetical protein
VLPCARFFHVHTPVCSWFTLVYLIFICTHLFVPCLVCFVLLLHVCTCVFPVPKNMLPWHSISAVVLDQSRHAVGVCWTKVGMRSVCFGPKSACGQSACGCQPEPPQPQHVPCNSKGSILIKRQLISLLIYSPWQQ